MQRYTAGRGLAAWGCAVSPCVRERATRSGRALVFLTAVLSARALGCEPETTPPPPKHVCDAGESRCEQGLRELCVDNAFTLDACADDEQCAGAGQCVCKDDSVRCGVEGRERCLAGAFAADPCPADMPVCGPAGQCKACDVGAARCQGHDRQVCGATQIWGDASCPPELPACWGAGQCRLCEPGAARCAAEGWAERCADDGLSWTPSVCPAATPVCSDGACLACADAPPWCAPALIGVNPTGCYVELSLGTQTTHPIFFFTGGFDTALKVLAGDVDADGVSDLLLLEGHGIDVKRGAVGTFEATSSFWSGNLDASARAHLVADFDGDGDDDLAEWSAGGVRVWRSEGTSFLAPTSWISLDFGSGADLLAGDVDGDGDADLVAASATIDVALSSGSGFAAPAVWLAEPPFATQGYHLGDLDADGDADLVAWQDSAAFVARSSGNAFLAVSQWSAEPFAGTRNHVLDVDSDGQADLVAQSYASLDWLRSQGSSLEPMNPLNLTPFLGSTANLPGRACITSPLCQ